MNMANEKGTSQLIAHISPEVADQFKEMCARRKHPHKDVLAALVDFWLKLPLDIQSRMLTDEPEAKAIIDNFLAQFVASMQKHTLAHKSSKAG